MSDVDLPKQDPAMQATSGDVRADLVAHCQRSSFFLGKAVLGYGKFSPAVHGPMCLFLDENPAQFKLVLMPRDHFKSTGGTITGTIRQVIRDPNSRSLIANESATNAERLLRAIRQHAESNTRFRTLFSNIVPPDTKRAGIRWNDHELDFVRQVVVPEPTIDTIGMTGAFTSRHYTYITADDMISEEAIKSPKVMEDTIERFKGFLSLLVEPNSDKIVVIGTRWALHDIYSWILRNLASRLAVYAVGVYNDHGEPIFPELMSKETLELKRLALGEYRFSCLYLNNPRNEELQDLRVDDLRWWRWYDAGRTTIELMYNDVSQGLHTLSSLDVTCTVDLAPAETATSDMNAVTVVGTTPTGQMVILDSWGKRCKPSELMEHIFTCYRRWHPRVFGIEAVAYQKAFKYFLKEECERRQIWLNVRDIKAIGRKEHRIRGLQPIMAAGRMYMHGGGTLLRNQMSEFPLGEHDDVVDSLSMHLQLMTNQLSPKTVANRNAQVQQAVARLLHREDDPVWAELYATGESSSLIIHP